ncbi:ATP-binding protein [Streptomyces sp. P9(2023)]|uniref:ATP-binding protein n=1 Tax=Streptomyces sp. P9(2023) TaxID=3064394 RepID=UPI0028F44886|nr:ATP-binding protein [Streptomyces sp. P9(2023)]MDT9689817.1 ATP-binding protein [Streptomyces sp. P9(2023)]
MHTTTPHQLTAVRAFTQRLSSTRRGARLARLLVAERLTAWEVSPGVAERTEQIVAELAANAILHGRVQGRDFQVAVSFTPVTGALRLAVTDARGERLPVVRTDSEASRPDGESGRGLLLVAALADRWGAEPYPPSGKTVWAEIGLRGAQPKPGYALPDASMGGMT